MRLQSASADVSTRLVTAGILFSLLLLPATYAAQKLGDLSPAKFTVDLWSNTTLGARNLVFDKGGDLLVLQTDPNSSTNALDGSALSGLLFPPIVALVDVGPLDKPNVINYTIVPNTSLPTGFIPNHGIEIAHNYLYLSNETSIWRWPYHAKQRGPVNSTLAELFCANMPWKTGGEGHTRTLIYRESDDKLFVADGLNLNIDYTANRSDIRWFPITSHPLPSTPGGWDWYSRPIWAKGLRNAVGLALQPGTNWLWETDQGIDDLYRADLGGDLHEDNPADELNLLDDWQRPATKDAVQPYFFGFPYCWTEGNLTNIGYPGKQWAQYLNRTGLGDAFCQNPKKNIVPLTLFQAHSAPLGIQFYTGQGCNASSKGHPTRKPLPCSYKDQLFFTLHGPDDRNVADGHLVGMIEYDSKTHLPRHPLKVPPLGYTELYGETNLSLCTVSYSGQNCWRPTEIKFDKHGRLFITENNAGQVWRMSFAG